MRTLTAVFLFVFILAGAACQSAQNRDERGTPYVFVYLKTGPKVSEKTPEERAQIQKAHLDNIRRLASESKLVVAGPFGKPVHDPSHRGIFIFNVATLEEARALTDTDPAVQEGVLAMELHPFRSASPLPRVLDFERESDAQAAKEGRTRKMGEGIRGYAMITAMDASMAERALAPLVQENKIVMTGRFGGDFAGRGLYVLNAADLDAAEKLIANVRTQMGEIFVDSWWATKNLERLNEVPAK